MPCPQHFHIHNFNEVNLFKTVRGLSIFSSLHMCLYQYAPFPIPSSPSQGEKSFFIPTTSLSHPPCLQVLVLSFPIRLPESRSRPSSFSVHASQRQFNKVPRQRERDNKRKRVVVVDRRVVMVVMGGGCTEQNGNREMIKEMDENSGRDRESESQIETVRKASNIKLDALGEETVN